MSGKIKDWTPAFIGIGHQFEDPLKICISVYKCQLYKGISSEHGVTFYGSILEIPKWAKHLS